MIIGADISSYQNDVDFAKIKAVGEVRFIFAKATESTGFTDDHFVANHDACKQHGIPFGAYHFLRFNVDPVEQAEHFLNRIDGRTGTLLPMVDVEVADGQTVQTIVDHIGAFTRAVEVTLGGKKMLLYTFYSFWNDTMVGCSDFSGHKLWLAEYNNDATPTLPNGFSNWVLWQYTSQGRVQGINGDVDLDRLNGDDLSVISR